jgi:phospholipid/cholesterol/gamma-HCH transport system ATP-binding protein
LNDAGLSLREVSFSYGDLPVLIETSLDVPRGSVLVVTGDNGVGKSTLLYVCAGLVPATNGRVLLDGHEPDPHRPSALFQSGVRCGFVFQNGGLLSNQSALSNVTLALSYHADVLGLDSGAIEQRARDALSEARVDQADMHSLPAHLSFGVRKRIALARALALEPNFVFFDDPDTGLDATTLTLFHDILLRYRDDPAVTMVVATNHALLLRRLGVHPFELRGGELLDHDD